MPIAPAFFLRRSPRSWRRIDSPGDRTRRQPDPGRDGAAAAFLPPSNFPRWLRHLVLAVVVIVSLSPLWVAQGDSELAMAETQSTPKLILSGPKMSPNGEWIVFSYKNGDFPYRIAAVPADPKKEIIVTFSLPPRMHWLSPAWSPDGQHIGVISVCGENGNECYEGATGYNVWRLEFADPEGRPDRITMNKADVARSFLAFGRDKSEIFYMEIGTVLRKGHSGRNLRNKSFFVKNINNQEFIIFPENNSGIYFEFISSTQNVNNN